MFRTFVETRFSAAHRINGYQGQCGKLHGHTWKVRVQIKTRQIDAIGISIDFKELRTLTENVLEKLDHQLINEIAPFHSQNPTAENLAKYVFEGVARQLPESIQMDNVTVWESDNYAVTYQAS
ncbi:6-carboxytetrahydropterin synthase QueD [bacterium]|nr:6-carboxytetrahydropterin synthase QueD [bacterium]